MSEVINDSNMTKVIIEEAMENFGFSKERAEEFAEENGEYIVSAMWNEYSSAFDYCMEKEK